MLFARFLLVFGLLSAVALADSSHGGVGPNPFDVILSISLRGQSCALEVKETIRISAPHLVVGAEGTIHVYSAQELDEILRSSQSSLDLGIKAEWERYRSLDHSNHPLANSVNEHLAKLEASDGRGLVFCLLDNRCNPKRGSANHYPLRNLRFEINHFHAHLNEAKQVKFLNQQMNSPGEGEEIPNVIMVASLETPRLRPHAFARHRVAEIMSELTRDHDFALLEEWIEANVWLIENGYNADGLFSQTRLVRFTQEGRKITKVELDTGFVVLFLESRSHLMNHYTLSKLRLRPLEKPKVEENRYRRFAISQINQLGAVADSILSKGVYPNRPVTAKNVFELGADVGAQFLPTIALRKRLDTSKP